MPHAAPQIRELDPAEIEGVLERNHVGRIAYAFHDRVDVEPIHYVYADGWIYGRTSPGTKLSTIRHNYWVAFEVDEIHNLFTWTSVVVHGGFYVLSPEGTEKDREVWDRAVVVLRHLVPEALTADDPLKHLTVLFRIATQEMRGRAAGAA